MSVGVEANTGAPSPSQHLVALDERMKAAGMFTIEEMMGVTPLTRWTVQAEMTDLDFFSEWLDRKVRGYLTMKAAYDLGDKDYKDELYEWVLAHAGAYSSIRENFQAARSATPPETNFRVKPLEWRRGYRDSQVAIWQANTIGGIYQIRIVDGIVWVDDARSREKQYSSIDEAKVAAQADHDPRVLALMTEVFRDAARDIKILLAQIDYLQEAFGEELSEEDAGIVLQIRETWVAQAYEGENNG